MLIKEKSKYTESCNRCGLCCMMELCPAAEIAFTGSEPPCPALVYDNEDKACCRLVSIEGETCHDKIISKVLGIGCGCSMPDIETTDEEIEKFNNKSEIKMFGLK